MHVFSTSDENCSRRTQAAAVAYMFPPNTMKIAIQLRLLTSARRYAKMSEVFLNVDVPDKLAVKSQTVHAAVFANEESVIVCDCGLNYSLPTSPPPSVRKFYLVAIHFIIVCFQHSNPPPRAAS